MKKNFSIIFLVLLFAKINFGFAQTQTWDKLISTSLFEFSTSSLELKDGNFFVSLTETDPFINEYHSKILKINKDGETLD
nr:hypothetical protein [Bacteroidota bacterium]